MEIIAVADAVGSILCQDITEIVPGEKKGPRFRKGHRVCAEDIPVLLALGKEHLYVWQEQAGMLHEEEAARCLYELCESEHLRPSEIKEGKIEAQAAVAGVLLVDQERLKLVNAFGEMMIATKLNGQAVAAGETVAGMRVIPLVIEAAKLAAVKVVVGAAPLVKVLPFVQKKIAVVTTGSEVYQGRIADGFMPVLREKLAAFPTELLASVTVPDSLEMITEAIVNMQELGADVILCTGGMSVDADDLTPQALRLVSKKMVCYGTPVLPGAMFALGYLADGQVVMGLPGSVMFAEKTVFDLLLPRVLADLQITAADIAELGHGGLL